MNWIPVDKRLPKKNERVSLVSIIEKGQPRVIQTYFLGNGIGMAIVILTVQGMFWTSQTWL